MRDKATRTALTLATKLRLTNQSRHTHVTAASMATKTAKGIKPWEK
jgi:hypothetical protein